MTAPGFYLGFLIATGLGLAFHIVRGGGMSRMLLYVGTAWLSFFVGHIVAELLEWHLLRVGPINLFGALLATAIGLILASVLVGPERKRRTSRRGRRKG